MGAVSRWPCLSQCGIVVMGLCMQSALDIFSAVMNVPQCVFSTAEVAERIERPPGVGSGRDGVGRAARSRIDCPHGSGHRRDESYGGRRAAPAQSSCRRPAAADGSSSALSARAHLLVRRPTRNGSATIRFPAKAASSTLPNKRAATPFAARPLLCRFCKRETRRSAGRLTVVMQWRPSVAGSRPAISSFRRSGTDSIGNVAWLAVQIFSRGRYCSAGPEAARTELWPGLPRPGWRGCDPGRDRACLCCRRCGATVTAGVGLLCPLGAV